MKILKILKSNIVGFVIGGVIVGSITVGAVTMFASSDVIYDNTNSGATSTDVQGALDELYELANNQEYYNPYAVGTPVYYNPVSGSKCFDYVSDNSLNENIGATTDTQCMKWYIIGEGTDTIDMILDHNTTKGSQWYTSDRNSSGPVPLLNQLHTDTDSWIGVPERTDTYTDPYRGYTINYNGYRARLIEANEIAELTGADKVLGWDSSTSIVDYYLDGKYGTDNTWTTQVVTNQGTSKYAWLFDYTDGCTGYGCNIADSGPLGYWTSSASANAGNAWRIECFGQMFIGYVESERSGLRPVITIPKF